MTHRWFRAWLVSATLIAAGCTTGGEDLIDGSFDAGGADAGRPDSGSLDAGPPTDGGECSVEACGDGLDGDCDGVVDEGCPCVPGETTGCFRGSAGQRGLGECSDGMMVCEDGLEFGTWGACTGDTAPVTEACDTEERDEDCDGAANEGCECTGSEPLACGSGVGECSMGVQQCIDGLRGPCEMARGPTGEVCNGADDDCDGLIDESVTRACSSDVGECRVGTETCVAGRFDVCAGGREPGTETCDDVDNDCDGNVDEDVTRPCGSAVGACIAGAQTCGAGAWSACSGDTGPSLETCDGSDEDCDGSTDEMLTRPCGSDVGACTAGVETCSGGSFGGACVGETVPVMEVCEGSVDENCDGAVDEGCGCAVGTMRPCGTDTGACMRGTQSCATGGTWGMCSGGIGPATETCDTSDEDCDGMVDEGVCPTGLPIALCGADVTGDVLTTVTVDGSGSDPDGGPVTYLWTVISRPAGSVSTPDMPTSRTTNFFLDASGTYELQLCVTDDEMDTTCCVVTVTSVPPGAIHVELSWDTSYGDADIQLLNTPLVSPMGWYTPDDCHWLNTNPDWGPAGVAGNPNLDVDDTSGFGPENITIDTMPVAGRYTVAAHYYCTASTSVAGGPPPSPGEGPTNATVRVFCDGALIGTYAGIPLTFSGAFVVVATIDYPSCVATSVLMSTSDTAVLPPGATIPRHCDAPCVDSSDCPSSEVCRRVRGSMICDLP